MSSSTWHPRLRAACDACAAAKVKCDKQQPTCERCRQLNFSCAYSPSRRHGKQSWASRIARDAQQPPQTGPIPTLSLLPVPVYTDNDLEGSMHLDGFGGFGSFDLGGLVDADVDVDVDVNVDLNMDSTLTASPLATSTQNMNMPAFTSPTLTSPTPPDNGPLPSHLSFQPGLHDCQAKALTTLQSLHYCTMFHSQLPGVLKQPVAGAPVQRPASGMLPLDKILLFNRLATATVKDLLECPCAQQPHVVILYVAILSRSLEWYGFAMAPQDSFTCPSITASTPSNGSAASPVTAPAFEVASARGVKPASVQIGDFQLEKEDQLAVMRNVLTREVKKLGTVLDNLQARHEQTTEDSQVEDGSALAWSNFGIPQLRAEVRNTLRRIEDFGTTT